MLPHSVLELSTVAPPLFCLPGTHTAHFLLPGCATRTMLPAFVRTTGLTRACLLYTSPSPRDA
eukprot:7514362-Heterocapsa_arctica.AAC.1